MLKFNVFKIEYYCFDLKLAWSKMIMLSCISSSIFNVDDASYFTNPLNWLICISYAHLAKKLINSFFFLLRHAKASPTRISFCRL